MGTAAEQIAILALGTRGDVQPYLALACGLTASGYRVRVVTSPRYEALVRRRGVDFAAIHHTDPLHAHQTTQGRARLTADPDLLGFLRSLHHSTASSASQRLADAWQGSRHATTIVASPLAVLMGYSIAERLNVPFVRACCGPMSPTGYFPSAFIASVPDISRRLNLWSHRLASRVIWRRFRTQINQARADVLGLGPLRQDPLAGLDQADGPVLYGYSPTVCAPPPDWGPQSRVTGYWFLDTEPEWTPPDALRDFLAAGPAPVYVGFGSMADAQPIELTRLVADALARAGQRGVLVTGWGGLTQPATALSSNLFVADDVPHDWLFQRVTAVVHHAGAGTTGAGLRAGLPTVTVPFGMPDQPFWARRVFQLGAGPEPIPRSRLTAERLAGAIRTAVTNPVMRDHASAIGARIRADDGVAGAAALLDEHRGRSASFVEPQ